MATVILQDLGIIEVSVGTAAAFRKAINDNFELLQNASQQLQDMVGPWDAATNKTINERLYGNSKIYIGTKEEYQNAVGSGLQMIKGDMWFEVIK